MRLPIGTVVLIIVGVLIYFGLAHRVLDRMRLTDRTALLLIVLMIAGSFVNVTISQAPELVINVGGAVVPLGIALYLILTADESAEKVRATLAVLVTAGAVYALGKTLNPEEQTMLIDPVYVFAVVAGLVAYVAGRSRRAAFCAGVAGLVLSDLATWVELRRTLTPARIWLGGAGVFDATVIAGLIAVLLAEIVGETREKIQGAPKAQKIKAAQNDVSGSSTQDQDGEGGGKGA